jgi:hypothetical protein
MICERYISKEGLTDAHLAISTSLARNEAKNDDRMLYP